MRKIFSLDKTKFLVLILLLVWMVISSIIVFQQKVDIENYKKVVLEIKDKNLQTFCEEDGYNNVEEWQNAVYQLKNSFEEPINERIEFLSGYISEEDLSNINNLKQKVYTQVYIKDCENIINEIESILDESQKQYDLDQLPQLIYQNSGYSGGSLQGLRSAGINYWNGTKYTWYSSDVLYHYRTKEWTVDEDGFYRDSEGYYVVASNDYEQNSIVETPYGEGKVYDSGCASGTIDMYVK